MEKLSTKHQLNFEVVKTRDFVYSHNDFEYTPPGWIKLESRWYPLGYKVVTLDNKSLGLRKNPTIFEYPLGIWVYEDKDILIPKRTDYGGIWSGASLSSARKTREYCRTRRKDPFETKIYLAAIKNPIYANSYGVKSQGIMILKQLV